MKNFIKNKLSLSLGPLFLLLFWAGLTYGKFIDNFLFPGPVETVGEMIELLLNRSITADIESTLMRIVLSFVIALVVGWPTGIALGMSTKLYKQTELIIDFFRSIPTTAMLPLFMLVFGVQDTSKIAVAAFSSALIIVFHTAHGVAHTNKSRVLAAKIMGANKWQIFYKIIFWESLPYAIVSFRNAVSLSLVVIVVTEMFIGSSAGIGKKLIDFQLVYDIKGVYAMVLLVGMIGYFLNIGLTALESHFVHWNNKM